jgi:hypothetical protein
MFTETDFQEVLVNYLLKQNKLYYHKVGEQTIYLGHQINNEIRLYENNEWKTVSENNQKIAEMKSTMMAIKAVAPAKKYNKLFGFLSYNDKKKAQEFKLVDKDKQTLKKTKAKHTKKGIKQDISKKSKLRGSICSNQKVVELLEYGKSLGYTETQLKVYTNKKGYKLSKHNREELCKMIEIKLREMDDQDDQLIWFETQN